jgi:hypothetical protein
MEPIKGPLKIYLGEFPVVQTKIGAITIDIGHKVYVTMHLGDFAHDVKCGDKLPLFTELHDAHLGSTPIQ